MSSPTIENKISVSWNELPAYAAKILREGKEMLGESFNIISTKPKVPIKGMEDILKQNIYWIEDNNIDKWSDLGLPVPNIFFQAGIYYVPSFKKLGEEVKLNGGKVILLSDNNFKKNFRQFFGSLLFRLIYKKNFDGAWVPGQSGEMLMSFFGFSNKQIYTGLYGSDKKCFKAGPPLNQRPKQFIFVGRLTYLKGVDILIKAFDLFIDKYKDWKIVFFGDGECKNLLNNRSDIILNDFAQPPSIAKAMAQSRFLVLPTLTDHWPLVVSESALVGCGMILSDKVGNSSEFLTSRNGFSFRSKSVKELYNCLSKAAELSNDSLDMAYKESLSLGAKYTTSQSAKSFCKIISDMK